MQFHVLLIFHLRIDLFVIQVIFNGIVDRIEDLTSPEIIRQNAKCDRTVSLYGFVRGIPLNKNSAIHISGIIILNNYFCICIDQINICKCRLLFRVW